ncbi:MAG: HlyD family secretion protein [Planctomycetes bacterium]|nr:HlyD family secretion protein [Planctomycetota bacterium]
MLELVFGVYGLAWWLIFKKFKLLPINLWSVVTSIFIAVATVLFLFLWVGRCQPVTSFARTYAITTPIICEVTGRVVEVTQEGGKPLKKGDVLFRVDPESYQARVDSLQAQLNLAQTRLKQENGLVQAGAGNQYDLDKAQTEVERLQADLRVAAYQLEATTARAPADGYVTQIVIRPGQIVMPMAFSQVMVFVHAEGPYLMAGFKQNASEFIDAGDGAEVAFDAAPGRVFKARVKSLQPLLAEGAISASGALRTLDDAAKSGRVPVQIEVLDDISEYNLPAGSNATVAVYTGELHHLDILRMMILRISSWENWVFLP